MLLQCSEALKTTDEMCELLHILHIPILSSSKCYKLADLSIFTIDIKYIQYPPGVIIFIELNLLEKFQYSVNHINESLKHVGMLVTGD